MPHISKGLRQAYELQDFTFEAALALKDSLTKEGKLALSREDAVGVGRLIDAWATCQERIRIHRRVPLPGSLRPKPAPAKQRRRFTEPILEAPVEAPESARPGSEPATVVELSTTQTAAPAVAAKPPPDEPCAVCAGKGTRHFSDYGTDVPCGACKGTGRQCA